MPLQRSLSILLPVHNDQHELATTVTRILEVLSDLSCQFELIIIDDGSTDATIEVADELAALYPQITALRHAKQLGRACAIRSGLQQSTGDIVLAHDQHGLERIDRGAAGPLRQLRGNTPANARTPQAGCGGPQRPNYLSKLRSFTLGE